jgi:hypothetical protein
MFSKLIEEIKKESKSRDNARCHYDYEAWSNIGYVNACEDILSKLEERQQELKKELQDRINGYDTCVIYDESECALEANQAERRALENLLWEWFGH